MANMTTVRDRRTSVDVVFGHLYEEIVSLRLLPGDKISEAEIASEFGVSRQPVRDAFSRLENLDLLLIRPQRATEVKRFSAREITKSRFVRTTVEAEVLRRASAECDAMGVARLEANLMHQAAAVEANLHDEFSKLDYGFHRALCEVAKVEFAFEIIQSEKAKVDRLCMLSLSKENRMAQLLEDHREITARVAAHDAEGAVAIGMLHLSRLDATIKAISTANPDYFDP